MSSVFDGGYIKFKVGYTVKKLVAFITKSSSRHSHESGNPEIALIRIVKNWIPVYTGMTEMRSYLLNLL